MRTVLCFVAFAAITLAVNPAHALPPSAVATVTCQTITIDPEPGQGVTFVGTIGTTPIDAPGVPVAGTHTSTADISTLTLASGPIPYEITPQWVIAPNPYGVTSGAGVTVSGTLTCHQRPPVTSTSVSPATAVPTATTTFETVTTAQSAPTTVCSEPRGCCLQDCGPTTLPRTGSSTQTLGIAGLLALCLGAIGLAHSRRKIR